MNKRENLGIEVGRQINHQRLGWGHRRRCQSSHRPGLSHQRLGQALVEFAIISFLLVTILSGVLGLGLLLLRANIGVMATQSMSNTLDQQIDDTHFASEVDLTSAIAGNGSMPVYFDEKDLVIGVTEYQQARQDFASTDLSLLTRELLSLYRFKKFEDGTEVYHFPGAIVERAADSELTVLVPISNETDADGRQIIAQWVKPVRFESLASATAAPVGSVIMNYPASSGVLIAYTDTGGLTPSGDPMRRPVSSDVSPSSAPIPSEYTLRAADDYGYDSASAYVTRVRIFQRVLTQTATFRSRSTSSAMGTGS